MSDSDSDYNVEEYIKPAIKRSTYENDDNYLSEEDKSNNSEKSESAESEEEVIDDIKEQIKEDSQCVLAKELPNENKRKDKPSEVSVEYNKKQKVSDQQFDRKKQHKNVVENEPVRTNNRFILYVSNLSSETTRTMLEAFFADCGALKSVRIPKKRLSHFAFVEMKDFEGYKNGLKFDGKELDGRKIKVQQGSKNKKHITNKTKLQKKNRLRIYESKFQNRIKETK